MRSVVFVRSFLFAAMLFASACNSSVQPSDNSIDPKSTGFNPTLYINGTWEISQTGGQNKHLVTISTVSPSICSFDGNLYTFDKFQDNYIHFYAGTTLGENLMFRPLDKNSMLIDLGHPFYNFDSTWVAVRK